jgi:hypothetical protein
MDTFLDLFRALALYKCSPTHKNITHRQWYVLKWQHYWSKFFFLWQTISNYHCFELQSLSAYFSFHILVLITFSKVSFNLRFSFNFYVGFALGSVEGRVALEFFDQTPAGLSKRYISMSQKIYGHLYWCLTEDTGMGVAVYVIVFLSTSGHLCSTFRPR